MDFRERLHAQCLAQLGGLVDTFGLKLVDIYTKPSAMDMPKLVVVKHPHITGCEKGLRTIAFISDADKGMNGLEWDHKKSGVCTTYTLKNTVPPLLSYVLQDILNKKDELDDGSKSILKAIAIDPNECPASLFDEFDSEEIFAIDRSGDQGGVRFTATAHYGKDGRMAYARARANFCSAGEDPSEVSFNLVPLPESLDILNVTIY